MLYRRKVILAIIQALGGDIEKLRLQKLLFLFSRGQKKPVYDFIPYKYGCYSFSAGADLNAMINNEQLTESTKSLQKNDANDYLTKLTQEDRKLLDDVTETYSKLSTNALIKHTYLNFPYYAINSGMAENLLEKQYIERINKAKPYSEQRQIYTIGYEGHSLEAYLNKLIKNDIKILVDTRKNPLSRKFGFSKNQLKKYCHSVGIEYEHFPETGIPSELRSELNSQSDYDQLFKKYEKDYLPNTVSEQKRIVALIEKYERIALTCFEANVCQCHRKPLAESIKELAGNKFDINHI